MLVSVCAQQPADWGNSFLSSRLSQYTESQDGRARDEAQVCVLSFLDYTGTIMTDGSRCDFVGMLQAGVDRDLSSGNQVQVREIVQNASEIVSELPERKRSQQGR